VQGGDQQGRGLQPHPLQAVRRPLLLGLSEPRNKPEPETRKPEPGIQIWSRKPGGGAQSFPLQAVRRSLLLGPSETPNPKFEIMYTYHYGIYTFQYVYVLVRFRTVQKRISAV
jgi:hypothetical protein